MSEVTKDDLKEVESAFKESKKKKVKKIKVIRRSGIRGGNKILFASKDSKYKFRLVPAECWNGTEEQEFNENEFKNFDKPSFYNGE